MTGAPYCSQDTIEVQVGGEFEAATVLTVDHVDRQAARAPFFGLSWMLVVVLERTMSTVTVYCDDNGQNRTIKRGVRPSSLVAA